jgi:iron complex outermembrane recepter protein
MQVNTIKKNGLFATSLLAGAAFLGVAPAHAQQAASAPKAEPVEEVVVTGSRIRQANLTSTSPVTQVTGADIQGAGVTRVEDLVNQLPQVFAGQSSTVSNGATGIATVDLRGLGPSRTLVLIDGRRMPSGSPNEQAADLNQIPGALVERVEVLTGGAGAVYGSDAVAGVVNFIMKKDFEGVRFDAQYGFFQHKNDNSSKNTFGLVRDIGTRNATNPAQFELPAENQNDGWSKEFTAIFGAGLPDGRGNVTAYAGYRSNDSVLQRYRDYSACSIQSPAVVYPSPTNGFVCGGSSTNATGRFTNTAFTLNRTLDLTQTQAFRPFSGALDQYNFGPLNYYQRPDERYTAGAFANYEINKNAEVFAQLMFSDYKSVAQIAPSGLFFGSGPGANGGFVIGCDNPLATTAQKAAFGCVGTAGSVEILIGRRNVEGGPRQDDLNYTSYRMVTGVRGEVVPGWDYEVVGQYSRVNLVRSYLNDFSVVRAGRAMDVVIDPATGQPACRAAIDPDGPLGPLAAQDAACVPYNVWRPGGITQAALNYIQTPGVQRGDTTQQLVSASMTGDLGTIGLKSPAAENAFKTAFGFEYRRETLSALSDAAFETGDLFGQGGATRSVRGAVANVDAFAELNMPLIEGKPGADLLSANVSYRYSDYNLGFTASSYGIGLEYAPVADFRARGSYQKAVRAPNVLELFSPINLGLFDADEDPCGPARTATLAQCVATGVPAANYGNAALDSPAGQYNQQTAGNAALQPEEGTTKSFGFVFAPSFLEGLNVSVDYFDIKIDKRIDTVGPLVTLDQCYVQNVAAACARIQRSNLGTLWTAGGFVRDPNVNIGGLQTTGVDVNFGYNFGLDTFGLKDGGKVSLSMTGTYLDKLETDPGVGPTAIYDCVGFYGGDCGTPSPKWRHRARIGWNTPWNVDVALAWRYYGKAELINKDPLLPRVDDNFKAQNYFDISGNWDIRKNISLRFGMNNVLDRDPPLSASVGTTGNGNTFPQTYDSLGRYVFTGLTVDF